MNCRPGDLAHITVPGRWYGCLVSVIEAAPTKVFRLPDGQKHNPAPTAAWVIESLGRPFSAPVETKEGVVWRDARYGVASDSQLRPIRPDGITSEEVRDLFAPNVPAGTKEMA